jgi:serine/threonine protein kinase
MASHTVGQNTLVGLTLGHYRITGKVGAGGMGEVYCARDEHLARDVAIKVLPPGTLIDESARKHFRKEALILSQLNHPNVATIHDFDTQQGVDFLVMEYIPGITLSEKVAGRPLPEQEVIRLGVQLAEGLAAAHDRGVVHRDLKPGNLRVASDGRLKILDFGLAKLVGPFSGTESTQSLGESQAVAGTLPYMAPEQLRGQACDARTDIYSAGAVLYEMATGQRLFPGAQSGDLVDAILHREPTPAGKVNPNVSLALEALIGKAVDKNPERRQQSARELLADLEALAVPSSAATPAAARQWLGWLKWRMRRRYRALLVAGAFLLAVVLSMVWLSGRTPALAFAARDFVLISDFENQTGDPVFDKSLTTAFTTSLGQSSYANIYSRLRINEVLKRMQKPSLDRIDEPLAQEIAVREGLKVIVLPSISGVGENYRVAASIRDVASGKDVKTELVKANGKNKVLDAVDTLSAAIREDLGESLRTVSQSKPLNAVTTQSLDALRQYRSRGKRP